MEYVQVLFKFVEGLGGRHNRIFVKHSNAKINRSLIVVKQSCGRKKMKSYTVLYYLKSLSRYLLDPFFEPNLLGGG